MNARQWSVVSGQWSAPPGDVPRLRAYGRRTTHYGLRPAFSLVELLIVIGIIVLIAMIAVPSFRALSGGRSTEAAENTISAVLARARTEALGLQEVRGVLFYRDQESQRIAMAQVMPTTPGPPWALDLVPDRDVVQLPIGVGIQFIDNYGTTGTPPARTDDGYIGFNTKLENLTTVVPYGGVVLFDGRGQLVSDMYSFRLRFTTPVARDAEMGRFLMDATAAIPGPPPEFAGLGEGSIGFVLFDDEEFKNSPEADDTDSQILEETEPVFVATERPEEVWLDENAVPILINRFNGTLLRGE